MATVTSDLVGPRLGRSLVPLGKSLVSDLKPERGTDASFQRAGRFLFGLKFDGLFGIMNP